MDGPLPVPIIGLAGESLFRWYASGLRYASETDGSDLIESPCEIQVAGGWFNVYETGRSDFIYTSKQSADFNGGPNRFACIEIPATTVKEGSGL